MAVGRRTTAVSSLVLGVLADEGAVQPPAIWAKLRTMASQAQASYLSADLNRSYSGYVAILNE